MQYAILVLGRYGIRVDFVRYAQYAAEAACEAFIDMHRGLFIPGRQIALAFRRDAEHAALEVDVDAGRVQARRKRIKFKRMRCLADVEHRVRGDVIAADADAGVKSTLHLLL